MNSSKIFTVTDPWGLTYSFTSLPREEALRLIAAHNGKDLTQFSSKRLDSYYYILDDNRVVSVPQGPDAYVFDSYAGFLSNHQTSRMYIAKHIPNTYPIHRIHYLKGGRKLYYDIISRAEAENLTAGLEQRLIRIAAGRERYYYLLSDGSVISEIRYEEVNKFASFQDFADFEDYHLATYRAVQEGNIGINQMCGRNPYGAQFPEHVDELCSILPALLNAPARLFNNTPDSLSRLDHYLYQHLITDYFAEEVFLPLLAYIGRIHILHLGGAWHMVYDKVWDNWAPDIQTADGRLLMIYNPLLEILDSREEGECWITLKSLV